MPGHNTAADAQLSSAASKGLEWFKPNRFAY